MKEMAMILSKEFKTQGNQIRLSKNIHTIVSCVNEWYIYIYT